MSEIASRRREEKDRRRNEIIDAAASVVAETGFDSLTMDSVARRARLSRALVYVYFEDKSALYLALCERALQLLLARFSNASSTGNGLARLVAIGRAYVAFAKEQPVYFESIAHLEARTTAELELGGEQCLQLGDQCHTLLKDAIGDGIGDGSIRSDVGDPDAVAIVLWGMVHGVIQLVSTKEAVLTHRNTSAAALFEHTFALALRALERRA
jgi:TetR/AcrR family transcriptional regulator